MSPRASPPSPRRCRRSSGRAPARSRWLACGTRSFPARWRSPSCRWRGCSAQGGREDAAEYAAPSKPRRVNFRHTAAARFAQRPAGSVTLRLTVQTPTKKTEQPKPFAGGAGHKQLLDPDEPEAGGASAVVKLDLRHAVAAQVWSRHGILHRVGDPRPIWTRWLLIPSAGVEDL